MEKERIYDSKASVGRAVNLIFRKLETKQRAFLLETFDHYNILPKGTSKERKIARNFVTKTAEELLQNPQDISIADKTWRRHEARENHVQESEEPFSELVKRECLALIKDEWEDVMPEQLAQLVRIYANNDPSQDTAKDLLRNYFKGPKNRNQRINASYNFVSGVLDLTDDEAFREGMKIALFATDIFPVNPSLAEQTSLLNFPHDLDHKVFQKLLITRRVIARVCFMGKWDLEKYYQGRADSMTNSTVIEAVNKRKENVEKEIGFNRAGRMYNAMKAAMSIIVSSSIEPTVEVKKQVSFDDTRPLDLAFNPDDPLNQKFERKFSDQLSRSSQVPS